MKIKILNEQFEGSASLIKSMKISYMYTHMPSIQCIYVCMYGGRSDCIYFQARTVYREIIQCMAL